MTSWSALVLIYCDCGTTCNSSSFYGEPTGRSFTALWVYCLNSSTQDILLRTLFGCSFFISTACNSVPIHRHFIVVDLGPVFLSQGMWLLVEVYTIQIANKSSATSASNEFKATARLYYNGWAQYGGVRMQSYVSHHLECHLCSASLNTSFTTFPTSVSTIRLIFCCDRSRRTTDHRLGGAC